MQNYLSLRHFDPLLAPFGQLWTWPEDSERAASEQKLTPAIDIKESDKDLTFFVDLPGVKAKDIDVHIDEDDLVISATRVDEKREENGHYIHSERREGSYQRRFTLPDYTEKETISAKHENGVLTVSIGKKPQAQPQKIAVEVS